MQIKFDKILGCLRELDEGTGGGGTGDTIITGTVATYAELPLASAYTGKYYIVDTTTGTWILGTKKSAGIYKSNGTTWIYIDSVPETTSLSDGTTIITGTNIVLEGTNGVVTTTDVNNNKITITGPSVPDQLSDLSDDSTHRLVTDAEKSTWNNKLDSYTETDPVFLASQANNITSTHITTLNNTSGTNTGDETNSTIVTKLSSNLMGRNLLINPTFAINQRTYVSGTNTTESNQFTFDRWFIPTTGQNLTFATVEGLRTVTTPASGICQVIEGAFISTGTYVLNWTGTAKGYVNGNEVSKGAQISLTGGSNISIKFADGTVSKPQFEKGSYPTEFEIRHIGAEIALCQRYCNRISSVNNSAYHVFSTGFNYSATRATGIIQLCTPMRATPTLTYSALSDIQIWANTTVSPTAISATAFSTSAVTLDLTATVSSGLSCVIRANNATGAYLQLTSELTS